MPVERQQQADFVLQGRAGPREDAQLLTYLRDSFAGLNKSLNAVSSKNMYDPIEGPYAGPNTRLGLTGIAIWHVADHYGQISLYLRLNGIVPPRAARRRQI
jgi:hypothetical protein